MSYYLIDSGDGNKLERWGDFLFTRPSSQAIWKPSLDLIEWKKSNGIFTREKENKWIFKTKIPSTWKVKVGNIKFLVSPTDFGHLGVFPEHSYIWNWMKNKITSSSQKDVKVLNLFAYSGGATIALSQAKASVCHVDASEPMIQRAKENMSLNDLSPSSTRWIADDAIKFLKREVKRGNTYDGILLDPPSFGRGKRNELFKIEKDIVLLLKLCMEVMSSKPLFFVFSCHTPGFSPLICEHLLKQILFSKKGKITSKEMFIPSKTSFSLPLGSCSIWER